LKIKRFLISARLGKENESRTKPVIAGTFGAKVSAKVSARILHLFPKGPPTVSIPAKRYNEAVKALGWKADAVATFFDVTERTAFRWQNGGPPLAVAMVLGLLVTGKISPAELQKLAGWKTNGK
jgi:hypothetical protein